MTGPFLCIVNCLVNKSELANISAGLCRQIYHTEDIGFLLNRLKVIEANETETLEL